ncbi:MAG: glycoside hydrolase family 15 protein, partial [Chloroflexota bacterium]
VHRYLEDEYYGGGMWIVLGGALSAAWASRDPRRANDILDWIEAQADPSGHLPEQVATHVRKPESRAAWIERWGPPARPLLWSHAMYLLGVAALRAAS